MGVHTADGQWENLVLELNAAISKCYEYMVFKAMILKSDTCEMLLVGPINSVFPSENTPEAVLIYLIT